MGECIKHMVNQLQSIPNQGQRLNARGKDCFKRFTIFPTVLNSAFQIYSGERSIARLQLCTKIIGMYRSGIQFKIFKRIGNESVTVTDCAMSQVIELSMRRMNFKAAKSI